MNEVRSDLAAGRPSFGCWCNLPTTLGAEALAAVGFSWIIVDLQHGGASWSDLAALTQAIELGGATPIVRVASGDPASVMRALDLGAAGVIIPMVDTADQARTAAEAMRYPPAGIRSFGMTRRRYAGVEQANEDVLCLPMIETAEGLADVEQIAATPGVDGLFFGPADMGLSIGIGLDVTMRNPAVLDALDVTVAAADRHGKFVGTVAADPDHAAEVLSRGAKFVSLGSDKNFVAAGAAAALKSLRATQQPA